jgi:hypothetical protein
MKIIIREESLDELILTEIKNAFQQDGFESYHALQGKSFQIIEPIGDEDAIVLLNWHSCEKINDQNWGIYQYDFPGLSLQEIKNICPFIEIHPREFNRLNGYFSDRWIPIFKNWFEKISNEKVKTIIPFSNQSLINP